MWAWRPSVHKKYPIWAQLLAVILGVHLFLLMPCFLLRQASMPYQLRINTALMNSNVPVIFSPLHEPVVQAAEVPARTITPTKPQSKKKNNSAKQKTKMVSEKKQILKTVALKDEHAKSKKIAKPADSPAKLAELENPDKRRRGVSLAKADKKIEQKVPKQVTAKQENPQEKIEKKQIALEQTAVEVPTQKQALYVDNAGVDQLTMQNAIQALLSVSWQPPVGLPEDVACQISFKVGGAGEIAELTMIKSSGILMYDIAVQNAIYESGGRLPTSSYGKEFCITFTQ